MGLRWKNQLVFHSMSVTFRRVGHLTGTISPVSGSVRSSNSNSTALGLLGTCILYIMPLFCSLYVATMKSLTDIPEA